MACPVIGLSIFQLAYLSCSFCPLWVSNPVELAETEALYAWFLSWNCCFGDILLVQNLVYYIFFSKCSES